MGGKLESSRFTESGAEGGVRNLCGTADAPGSGPVFFRPDSSNIFMPATWTAVTFLCVVPEPGRPIGGQKKRVMF